jgi:2-aminobenzoate-CoA ligase
MTLLPSALRDPFAREHLPPEDLQPDYLFDRPEYQFPETLNAAQALLDGALAKGWGERLCIQAPGLQWSYAELNQQAKRIAQVLVEDMGLVSGNRVLLRSPNNPLLAACWFAVVQAGGIAVATMPMLRAKELKAVIDIAQVSHALVDGSLMEELLLAREQCPSLRAVGCFQAERIAALPADARRPREGELLVPSLEAAMAEKPGVFQSVATSRDDVCLLGFTSGTTGVPKATMHFHRDVMAICEAWPRHTLRPRMTDVFIGSPPLGFTFGLGGLLLFPMAVGASTVLLEKATPPALVEAISQYQATTVFTSPTAYRAMAAQAAALRGGHLRQCVSAGEVLPAATRALWKACTGIELIDGIGATEMLHIFISADEGQARPGATGKPVPGYVAEVVDEKGQALPPGQVGRLRVKGPTGCRYLGTPAQGHERQKAYVQQGWNYTGDAYLIDDDGYFHYQARTDDMIISSGYNIAAPEVEDALMLHPAVLECAVVGAADAERGQVVQAHVVLREGHEAGEALVRELQDFVKRTIAPYKYPRSVVFAASLPRTATGKLQRFRLKAGV